MAASVDTQIRYMTPTDLREVLKIEEHEHCYYDEDFEMNAVDDETWTEQDFLQAVDARNMRAYVMQEGEVIVGFCVIEFEPAAILIRNLTVHQHFRRSRFASSLLGYLYEKIIRHDKRKLLRCYIHEDNRGAWEFFKYHKFKSKLVPNFYGHETLRDGVLWTLRVWDD